jgi:hypothetical protein
MALDTLTTKEAFSKSYMLHVRDVWMMFLRQKNEPKSVEQVDATQRCDTQVKEDAEDDGRRNEPQK